MSGARETIATGRGLTGKFLVAMPGWQDAHFERAVLFVCSHNKSGALGLVINQPHMAAMSEVLAPLGLEWERPERPIVYQGGPVALDRGFMLYEDNLKFPGHLRVCDSLYLGTNPAILRHMVQSAEPGRFLFALGYAGWSSGQLERELRDNVWLVSGLDRTILFDLPTAARWESAMRLMGIDPLHLVDPGRGLIH